MGTHLGPLSRAEAEDAVASPASGPGNAQTGRGRPDRKALTCAEVPYTIGMWEETKPVEIALVKGKNMLHFMRDIPNYGLTIKHFTLTPVK